MAYEIDVKVDDDNKNWSRISRRFETIDDAIKIGGSVVSQYIPGAVKFFAIRFRIVK